MKLQEALNSTQGPLKRAAWADDQYIVRSNTSFVSLEDAAADDWEIAIKWDAPIERCNAVMRCDLASGHATLHEHYRYVTPTKKTHSCYWQEGGAF